MILVSHTSFDSLNLIIRSNTYWLLPESSLYLVWLLRYGRPNQAHFVLPCDLYYSAGKRDRGKRHPQESGGEAPRLHRTGGEAPCSMKGRKTRREENVFKGVENLPALLYTIV